MAIFNIFKKKEQPKEESPFSSKEVNGRKTTPPIPAKTDEVENIVRFLRESADIAEDLSVDYSLRSRLNEVIDRFEIIKNQESTKETIAIDNLILSISKIFKAQCINNSYTGISYYIGVLNGLLKDRASGLNEKYANKDFCNAFEKYHKLQAEVKNFKADIIANEEEKLHVKKMFKENKITQTEAIEMLKSLEREISEKKRFEAVFENKEKILIKLKTVFESSAIVDSNEFKMSNGMTKSITDAIKCAETMSASTNNDTINEYLEKLDEVIDTLDSRHQSGYEIGRSIIGEKGNKTEKDAETKKFEAFLNEE